MTRYINSDDALNTLKHLAYETAMNPHDPYVADVFEDIAKNRLETWVDLIPTADVVERKKGKWLESKESTSRPYMCSNCGCLYDVDTIMGKLCWHFCPNCGTKMDGKETEDDSVAK